MKVAVRKQRDPNYLKGKPEHRVQKDRGAGWYYHRGNGQWSKVEEPKTNKRHRSRYEKPKEGKISGYK